jgi:hypothetical protein
MLAPLDQDLAHGGTGDGEIRLGWHLSCRFGLGGSGRVALVGHAGVLIRMQAVELIGDTAAAAYQGKREKPRARLEAPYRVP